MSRWSLVVVLLGGCAAPHGGAPVDADPAADGEPGDSDPSDTDVDAACAPLVDRTFSSLEAHECGMCPGGPCTCTWAVAFTATTWAWSGSDYTEEGTYTCAGGVIVGENQGFEHHGVYDPHADLLTWDALPYR